MSEYLPDSLLFRDSISTSSLCHVLPKSTAVRVEFGPAFQLLQGQSRDRPVEHYQIKMGSQILIADESTQIVSHGSLNDFQSTLNEAWIKAMKEELQQFDKNDVWTLVLRHEDYSIIRTR